MWSHTESDQQADVAAQQGHVALEDPPHPGALHLDDDRGALLLEHRPMNLGDRGGGPRLLFEALEHPIERTAQGVLDDLARHVGGEADHSVGEPRELGTELRREDVGAQGDQLADLDPQPAEIFDEEP